MQLIITSVVTAILMLILTLYSQDILEEHVIPVTMPNHNTKYDARVT